MKKGILMLLLISVMFTLSSCKAKLDDQFDRTELDIENSEVDDLETFLGYLSEIVEHVTAYEELMGEQNINYIDANIEVFEDMTVSKSELTPMNIENELRSLELLVGSDLERTIGRLDVEGIDFKEGIEFTLDQDAHITTYANENYFYYRVIDSSYDTYYSELRVKILSTGGFVAEQFRYKMSENLGIKEILYTTTDTRKGTNHTYVSDKFNSINLSKTEFNYIKGEYKIIQLYDFGLKQVDYNQVTLNDDSRMKTRFIKNVAGINTDLYEVSGYSDDSDRIYKYSETHEQTGNIRKNLTYSLSEVSGWTNIEDGVMMNDNDEINTLGSIFHDSGEFINYLYDPLEKETFLRPHEGIEIDVDFDQFIGALDDLKTLIDDYGYNDDGDLTYAGDTYTTFDEMKAEFFKDIPDEYKVLLGIMEYKKST